MKIATVKAMVAKVLAVGVLAGAVVIAAPTKAQAQEVFVGVGGPYARHNFYERERIEAFRRHEAFVRAEEFRRFRHDRFEHDRFYQHDRFYRGYR
jgi:hypothetical protein